MARCGRSKGLPGTSPSGLRSHRMPESESLSSDRSWRDDVSRRSRSAHSSILASPTGDGGLARCRKLAARTPTAVPFAGDNGPFSRQLWARGWHLADGRVGSLQVAALIGIRTCKRVVTTHPFNQISDLHHLCEAGGHRLRVWTLRVAAFAREP